MQITSVTENDECSYAAENDDISALTDVALMTSAVLKALQVTVSQENQDHS